MRIVVSCGLLPLNLLHKRLLARVLQRHNALLRASGRKLLMDGYEFILKQSFFHQSVRDGVMTKIFLRLILEKAARTVLVLFPGSKLMLPIDFCCYWRRLRDTRLRSHRI